MRFPRRMRGQAMSEFALVAPLFVLLMALVFLAYLGAWRSFAADWGLFSTGAATGVYAEPHTADAEGGFVWASLRDAFSASTGEREVQARIDYSRTHALFQGLVFTERQQGQVIVRLWRFYPGPEGEP